MNDHEHEAGELIGTNYQNHEDDDGEIFMITCSEFRKCKHCDFEMHVEFDVRPEDFRYWIDSLNHEHWSPL